MSFLKKAGDIETTTVVCVVLAILTFVLPWLVALLWIAAAVLSQLGIWDRTKTLLYVNFKQRGHAELASKTIEKTASEKADELVKKEY